MLILKHGRQLLVVPQTTQARKLKGKLELLTTRPCRRLTFETQT